MAGNTSQDDEVMITEENLSSEYIAHSLDGKIFEFESNAVKGAVFYLPEGPTLGGDSFIIYYDSLITSIILNDFVEKREAARKHIRATKKLFLKILEQLSDQENDEQLPSLLYELDKKLVGLDTQSAITILRTPEKEFLYFNGGENFLFYYDSKTDKLEGRLKHWPKLGIFSRVFDKDKFLHQFGASYLKCNAKDKLIVCSDGVGDLNPIRPGDRTFLEQSVNEARCKSPSNIIKHVNQKAKSGLGQYSLEPDQNAPDDYTVIAVELK